MTRLLRAWAEGDAASGEAVLPLVYDGLVRRAAARLRRERHGHTLQPTALVHEMYLRLSVQRDVVWQSRVHFFAIASQLMRRILVDYARARAAAKRPDEALRIVLEDDLVRIEPRTVDLLLLDEALTELAHLDPRQGRIVELCYFGGLSESEVADVLAVSRSTVAREWRSARAWLYRRMTSGVPRGRT